MEWFTIVLAGLLAAITPTGLILDQVVASNLRQQVEKVAVLKVRVDNIPSYQVLQGKIDKVRIASRGIYLLKNVRIDTLEIESDPISIDLETWNQTKKIRQSLRQPLQGGIRLLIQENDLNKALASDNIKSQIQKIIDSLRPEGSPEFKLINAQVEFLENQRIRANFQLEQTTEDGIESEQLNFKIEFGLKIIEGRTLQFTEPKASINEQNVSSRFLNRLLNGFSENFSLKTSEKQGLIVRILDCNIENKQISLVIFTRLNPN